MYIFFLLVWSILEEGGCTICTLRHRHPSWRTSAMLWQRAPSCMFRYMPVLLSLFLSVFFCKCVFVNKQTVLGGTIPVNTAFVPSGASLSSSSGSSAWMWECVCVCVWMSEWVCVCVNEWVSVCVCVCVQAHVKLLSWGRKSGLPLRAHFGLY